jgi:hypothetical protein
MEDGISDYNFLLGWLLIQPARLDWLDLTMPVLSASNCICEVRTSSDDWFEEEERLAFLQKHQRNVEGNFIFLDTYEHAAEMNEKYLEGAYRPVALALRPQEAKRFDATLRRYLTNSNKENPRFIYTIHWSRRPSAGGTAAAVTQRGEYQPYYCRNVRRRHD